MKRSLIALFMVLLLIVSVVGCGKSGDPGSDEGVIVIGQTEPLTGPIAVYGLPQANSVKMAIDEINENGGLTLNGKTYKLKHALLDSQFDSTLAMQNIKKMIEVEKAQFLIGFISGSEVLPSYPFIEEKKIPTIVAGAPDTEISTTPNPYVFHLRPPSDYTGMATGQFIYNEFGVKKIAFVGTTFEGFFKDLIEGVESGFTAAGGTITITQGFKVGDQDITAQITAAIATQPDAIYVAADVESAAFVYQQANELGFQGKLLGFNGGSEAQFGRIVSLDKLEGIYDMIPAEISPIDYALINGPYGKTFLDKYKELYKEEAPPVAGYGYDAMMALASAIQAAGTTDPDAVVKALTEIPVPNNLTMKWVPVDGKLFDKGFQAYISNVAFVWKDGQKRVFKEMESPVAAYSKALYEIREKNR